MSVSNICPKSGHTFPATLQPPHSVKGPNHHPCTCQGILKRGTAKHLLADLRLSRLRSFHRALERAFGELRQHLLRLRRFNKRNRCGNKDLDDISGLFCEKVTYVFPIRTWFPPFSVTAKITKNFQSLTKSALKTRTQRNININKSNRWQEYRVTGSDRL
jgi:hypothetical protein